MANFEIKGSVSVRDLALEEVELFTPIDETPPLEDHPASVRLTDYAHGGMQVRGSQQRVFLYHLKNAKVLVGGDNTGLILTNEDLVVREPSCFTAIARDGSSLTAHPIEVRGAVTSLARAAIGFDASWTNYYHWLMFAIGRSLKLRNYIDSNIPILLPEYSSAPHCRFSQDTYQDSINLLLKDAPVYKLAEGLYKIEDLYFLWTEPAAPTQIIEAPDFLSPFEAAGALTYGKPASGRYYFSRGKGGDPRMSPAEQERMDDLLTTFGFETVYLETLSFREQVHLASSAQVLMGPHGAGLTNLVFSGKDTFILELNRRLAGEDLLRPWFYQLASLGRKTYAAIDMDRSDCFDGLTALLHAQLSR